MASNPRDSNRVPAIGAVSDIDGTTVHPATYSPISGVDPVNVAIVDGAGAQITSFGGGTQYTDAGTPPAHPVGPTLEFNNAGAWATVGSATPLPVTGSFSLTNPSTGAAVPATANYIAANNGGNLTGLLIGQQTAANSLAVILPSATISTLTPLSTVAFSNTTIAVTNTGTFATQATLAAETTKVIGTVNQGTSPWVVSGAVTNTGTFAVQAAATLAAETTKVIGTVNPALVSSVIVGQKKITASAVQLGAQALTNGVIFTALSTNAGNIFIGGSGVTTTADGAGNGYILEAGNSISFAATNLNLYYVIGTANDVLSWAIS